MHVKNCKNFITNGFMSIAWQLRYNGHSGNVNNIYTGKDNSDVGDGMENVYQDGQLSAQGGSLKF